MRSKCASKNPIVPTSFAIASLTRSVAVRRLRASCSSSAMASMLYRVGFAATLRGAGFSMGYFAETVVEDIASSGELHRSLFTRGMLPKSCERVKPEKAIDRLLSGHFHREETRIQDRRFTRREPGSKQFRADAHPGHACSRTRLVGAHEGCPYEAALTPGSRYRIGRGLPADTSGSCCFPRP
jgi:hypothetical protein